MQVYARTVVNTSTVRIPVSRVINGSFAEIDRLFVGHVPTIAAMHTSQNNIRRERAEFRFRKHELGEQTSCIDSTRTWYPALHRQMLIPSLQKIAA